MGAGARRAGRRVTTKLQAAQARAQQRDLPGAEALVREVLLQSPNDPFALNMLAMLQRSQGRIADAQRRRSRRPSRSVPRIRRSSSTSRFCAAPPATSTARARHAGARWRSTRASRPRAISWPRWRSPPPERTTARQSGPKAIPMTKRNAFYAQSGGVTAVINASAAGVIETARKHKSRIGKVYAGRNGIIGALTEDLIDTSREPARAIAALKHTPAGAFGSCRYKLKGLEENRAQYERLIEVFRAHDIGYFFYNGGNDSADTCLKVVADRREARLSAHRRARAEDRRQRSRRHRQLPRLRLGREIRRDVDARGGVRRRVDGEDVDQGVRARGDGPPRRLDHRGGRHGRRREDADSAGAAVPGDPVRRGDVPRRRRRQGQAPRLLLRRRVGRALRTRRASCWPKPARATRSATRSSAASVR